MARRCRRGMTGEVTPVRAAPERRLGQDGTMRRTIFTEDHELFRESFRSFVDKEITPHHLDWERDGIVPRSLFTA
ncbi:MAG: acyl-CoA dehydrogenase family protein, partial [Acidimicrobiales bacterium]